MNYSFFYTLYAGACKVEDVAKDNLEMVEAVKAAQKQKMVLMDAFRLHFPKSFADAHKSIAFCAERFFEVLVEFPETWAESPKRMKNLIDDFEDNGVPFPTVVVNMCERLLKLENADLTEEQKQIKATLEKHFPVSYAELKAIPYNEETVLNMLAKYPCEKSREDYLSLMVDLMKNKVAISEDLRRGWIALALEP